MTDMPSQETRRTKVLRLREKQTQQPKTSLSFPSQELKLIREALGLPLPPDLRQDDA
jgi:hypothetical protein